MDYKWRTGKTISIRLSQQHKRRVGTGSLVSMTSLLVSDIRNQPRPPDPKDDKSQGFINFPCESNRMATIKKNTS